MHHHSPNIYLHVLLLYYILSAFPVNKLKIISFMTNVMGETIDMQLIQETKSFSVISDVVLY